MLYRIEWSDGASVHLQLLDEKGQVLEDVPQAVTTSEACKLLGRSRRHLYRYIQRGWLVPAARFSGEYFFRRETVQSLRGRSERKNPSVPASLVPLFPDYDLKSLHPQRDAALILSRIFEQGGRREIAWALKSYPRTVRQRFIRTEGRRLLSKRALRFWSWLWKIRTKTTPTWREQGLSFGGSA